MIQKYIAKELRDFAINIGIAKRKKRTKPICRSVPAIEMKELPKTVTPEFCNISVNEECFFKCKMCFKWQPDKFIPESAEKTTTEDIKKFIKGLRSVVGPGFLINFAGGETLLRKDMFELIRYATDLGFETNLASNGWLITKDVAKKMIDSGLGSINFSLDGSTPEMHDFMRGKKGSFDRLMNAIENLVEYMEEKEIGKMQFRIAAQAVVTGLNIHDMPDLIRFVDNHPDILSIKFNVVMEPNNTGPNPNWYKEDHKELWPQDEKIVNKVFDEIIELKKAGSKVPDRLFQLEAYRNYFKNPEKFVKSGPCNFDRSINLSSTGDMFLCFNFANIGNIRDISFEEAWDSEKADKIRKEIVRCQHNCHFLINCNLVEEKPQAEKKQII
ncbi:radical SAM protein [Candidatus Woesearchaeota archaeon]|nr:radical SAM protein [Candidatus Woesearchaeota archaeon]